MADSGKAFTDQHDVISPSAPVTTIDDQDEDQVDGGEINEDPDKIHTLAFGDEDNEPIDKEINKDEIAITKGLSKKQQK